MTRNECSLNRFKIGIKKSSNSKRKFRNVSIFVFYRKEKIKITKDLHDMM